LKRRFNVEGSFMNPLEAFGWGCAGSFALEVVHFCHALRESQHLPHYYRRKTFIVGRVLLMLVGGVVAAAWGIAQPIHGLALGAAAPRLILALERMRLPIPGDERHLQARSEDEGKDFRSYAKTKTSPR
jgi:hypothetical protein